MKFTIYYIDGHDLKYKTFRTTAKDKDEAISNLWKSYESDFDHQIIEIKEEEEDQQ